MNLLAEVKVETEIHQTLETVAQVVAVETEAVVPLEILHQFLHHKETVADLELVLEDLTILAAAEAELVRAEARHLAHLLLVVMLERKNPAGAGSGGANQGGGGGGNGGSGGTGVVIMRIPTASYSGLATGGPTVTTDGSDTIVKFTGTGTYNSG
jgi:uncharacterized membrane protein YgcG